MKQIRRVFFYLALFVGVLVVALTISVVLYKDRILAQFVAEANKHLNTPVKIGKMDVSMFEHFPAVSVVFHDVYVEDSQPGQYPLLTAKKISFQLNPIRIWNGDYSVNGLDIENSETNLKVDSEGITNYNIVVKSSAKGTSKSMFSLKDVRILDAVVHYMDVRNLQDFSFKSSKLLASIGNEGYVYDIEADGEVEISKMLIGKNNYFEGRKFDVASDLVYDDDLKHLVINPSKLSLGGSRFEVEGTYDWKDEPLINIKTTGTDTDIQTILSLLPESKSERFRQYKSDGNVYFNAALNGPISSGESPALKIDFGFQNATLYHPASKARIERANMQGTFTTRRINDLSDATLSLKGISGKLNKEDFRANFLIHDFVHPELVFDFKGKVDAASLLDFYPVEEIRYISGAVVVDIAFEGRIDLLKNRNTAQQVATLGTIDMIGVNLLYGRNKVPLEGLRGNLQFNNNDLALSNVTGKLGDSDFVLNGFFKNIVTFLLFENQPIGIEADLRSNYIDLNQLLAYGYGESQEASGPTDQYTFSVSKNVNLNFNCDIQSLKYKRFHGQAIRGDLLVKNQMAVSRNLSLETMGGALRLSGILDAKNPKAIDVVTTLNLKGIHVDSVFFVFEDFNQTFIRHQHLKGRATADVNLEMSLNQNLRLFQETLIADIGIRIAGGQLNNFEPLKKLEKYVGDASLDRVRFSELNNDIHIENKSIYLPQMEVGTNVTNIKISGTHTFDQRIDYRVVTPLRRKRVLSVEAENATESDDQGNARLFLKITGTTDDYRVAYDTEAVKKKIINDLKQEVKELKAAFKSGGKRKEKEVEVSQDEYFDW